MQKKKGQAQSFLPFLLVGLVVVFIFAIVTVPVAHVADEVFDEFQGTSAVDNSSQAYERTEQVQGLITPAFDQLVFIILFSIVIGTLVVAIFTDYHPVVVGVFIIAIILMVIIAGLMANVYDDTVNDPAFGNKADEFTFTNVIMGTQFPIIIGISGVIAILILLSKRGRVVGA